MKRRTPTPGGGEWAPACSSLLGLPPSCLPYLLLATRRRLSPFSPTLPPAPACRVQLLGKRQALQEALQGLQVARCSQAKLQAQQELLQTKLEQLGPGEPPPVLLLQDDRHSTSSSVSCPARAAARHRPAHLGLRSSFSPSPSLSLATR